MDHPIRQKILQAFEDHPQKDGTIYVIGNRHARQVKIGYTSDASAYTREKHCQTHSVHEIETLAKCAGSVDLEKRLQAILGDFHWRGEWFFLSLPVDVLIEEMNRLDRERSFRAQRKAADAWEHARQMALGVDV
jgi:hypothetical protein